jgi:translation elongation factor P/translation initiation factor 5A
MYTGILLVLAAVAVFFFFTSLNKNINTVPIVSQSTPIIFMDQTDFEPVDGLSKDQIINTISNQMDSTKVKVGGIDGLYLTENQKVIGFQEFTKLINGNLTFTEPNYFSDNFLLGIFNDGSNPVLPAGNVASSGTPELFMLLKVNSFIDIFPVMQNWENKILYDLGGFFGIKINPQNNYLFTKSWQDGIIDNKNARILYDNNGNIVLMYVYADDNSIIISNSENAVDEIILRLNSGNIKQ